MSIKRKLSFISLMLVVLILSTIFVVSAADASTSSVEEATMMVTKNEVTTTKHGSFDSLMLELDNAETSVHENAVITIDINKDFRVGGKGYWEFRNMSPTVTFNLNLNGHTVTATSGNVIQVRTGYKLNVNGAGESGKAGTWIATGGGASMFFVRDVQTKVNVENLNIVSTNLSTSGQPVLHFMTGDVFMKNVRVTYTGTNFPQGGTIEDKNIIKQGPGKLTLENCVLEDTSSGKLKFAAIDSYSNPTIELKNTEIKAYYGFKSTGTSITMENCKVTANAEVFNGTSTVFVTDSELLTSGASISVAKSDVTYNYGTGKNSVTVGNEMKFADTYKTDVEAHFAYKGNGKYVLELGKLEEVTVTIVKNGVTTTKSCSFDSFMLELDNQETALSENTTYNVVLNKSFTVGGKGWWELKNMSPTAILNIDLNGHTVTASAGNVIQVRTAYTLNVDGADDNGNIGTWYSTGGSASAFYMQVNAGDNARANIQNINIVSTNLSSASQPVVHLQCGITTMKNVKITYTGTNFPTNGTIEDKYLIAVKQSAHLVLENCTLADKSSGKLNVYGIWTVNTATFSMNNTTVNAYGGFKCATGSNVITNSKISVKSDVFIGGASFTVTDSELVTAKSTFSSTTGNVTFNYGEGKTSVTIASGSDLTDRFVVEEGYVFRPYGNGRYVLESESIEEVTVTIVKNGVTTTKSCSFDSFMLELDNQETALSENTTYNIVLNKSFTVGGKGWWELKNMSPTSILNIDLNGHTVTASAGNVIQVRTAYTLNIDGADDNGNIGTWRAVGNSASMFYMQMTAGADARANIENINIVCTNLSTTTQPVVHLQSGTTTMKNVKITYTGTDFPTNGTIENKYLIAVKRNANLVLEGCTLEDKSSGRLNVYGILTENTATFTMNNTTVSAYGGFKCAPGLNVITNSKVSVTSDVFLGGASFTVTDSELITAKSTFSSTTGNVTFNYGEGKTSVTITGGSALTDIFNVEEGYGFIPYGNGKYVLGSDSGLSTVKMTSIFSDGMVFQRDMPINVFGTCRKVGAEIKITLGGETVIAVVDSTGNFKATFGARSAAKGLTLTVEQLGVDTPTVLTYTDVAIGEVIVISGQSNAAYELYKMEDAAEYIANADSYSNIKVFRTPRKYEFYEVEEGIGSWYTVTSELLKKSSVIGGDVSAIGYVLATRMADEFGDDVAIALIDASYEGSGIYSWIEFNDFEEAFTGTSYYGAQSGINRYNDYVSFYLKNGRYPISADEVSSYNEKPYKNTPGVCYNTMIAPIEGYTAKCVVWYQGEENYWSHVDTYRIFFDVLKENYKKAFSNDDLKFFAVQLAPDTVDHSDFRATQYNLGEADDTFVISTSKEGPVFNSTDLALGAVHPSRKSPVGHRLADSILKNVYGYYGGEVVEAPKVVCVTANGNKLIIVFDTDIYLSYGSVLEGFEIAGADKKFKAAVGEISGNIVTLTATGIDSPAYVRYAYGCMQLVLSDGTVLPYNPSLSNSIGTDKAVIIGPDGTEYVFDGDPSLVIETRYVGNLTNESEHPMPTFMLEVGYGELNISGMKANLSLYSDFKINLYVPVKYAPCIISINGETPAKNEDGTYVTVTLDGIEYVTVSVSKVASDASTKAVFKILLSNGIERTVSISITDYAERILSGGYTEADETLMVYMLKYILAAEKYFCGSENGAIVALIGNRYDPDFIDNNYSNGVIENMNLSEVFSDASIVLEDAPVFKFTLDKDKAFKGTITVTYGVNTKIFNVDKAAGEEYSIKVNGMKIYNFGVKLTITATPDEGEVVVGYCNLATYADYHYNNAHDYDSLTREESEEALPLIEALYEYVKVSEMYKKGTLAK